MYFEPNIRGIAHEFLDCQFHVKNYHRKKYEVHFITECKLITPSFSVKFRIRLVNIGP